MKESKGKFPPKALIARLEFNMRQVEFYQAQVKADQETIKKYLNGGFDEKDPMKEELW